MKIIAYYRVSTEKQRKRKNGNREKQGLGLEAQRLMVKEFAARNKGTIVAEYTEIESGRNSKRPELAKALDHTRNSRATLVVAKLDRLSRNLAFTATLMDSGVEFVACDNPHANRLTIHILAAMAEQEAVNTSRRTKDALAVLKKEGAQLGSARPGHWEGREHLRGWKKGVQASVKARVERARATYSFLLPKMQQMRDEGVPYYRIAESLNADGYQTTRGMPFQAATVCRILQRAEKDAATTTA